MRNFVELENLILVLVNLGVKNWWMNLLIFVFVIYFCNWLLERCKGERNWSWLVSFLMFNLMLCILGVLCSFVGNEFSFVVVILLNFWRLWVVIFIVMFSWVRVVSLFSFVVFFFKFWFCILVRVFRLILFFMFFKVDM